MEDAIDSWMSYVSERELNHNKTFDTLWSGDFWRADCSHPACEVPCHLEHIPLVMARIHIKITITIDWFTAHKSRYSGNHASGAILMQIDNIASNLMTSVRKCAGIHVVGILPGPKDPTADLLPQFLKPLTDELNQLYVDGTVTPTARHPVGESSLHFSRPSKGRTSADTEVRAVPHK